MSQLQRAIERIKAGDKDAGARILANVLYANPRDESA